MDIDLRLVKYFVAVAQAGNVTRAAERLHISQPSLSAAVKQLGPQLGVVLLPSRGRGLVLTPAGELLLARGLALLEHAGAVADEVRGRGADAPAARPRPGLAPTARAPGGARAWRRGARRPAVSAAAAPPVRRRGCASDCRRRHATASRRRCWPHAP